MEGGEGDEWFRRNLGKLGEHDPVTDAIVNAGIKPKYALEIGCANGWRLDKLRKIFNCGIMGVEPSMKAGIAAAQLRVPVHQMTASCIPVSSHGYDLLIYGFCLYLTDPDDWLLIASEGDRALAPGGHIVIHDFEEPERPYCVRYDHDERLRSYHIAWPRLWLGNPNYRMKKQIHVAPDQQVTILEKTNSVPLRTA